MQVHMQKYTVILLENDRPPRYWYGYQLRYILSYWFMFYTTLVYLSLVATTVSTQQTGQTSTKQGNEVN